MLENQETRMGRHCRDIAMARNIVQGTMMSFEALPVATNQYFHLQPEKLSSSSQVMLPHSSKTGTISSAYLLLIPALWSGLFVSLDAAGNQPSRGTAQTCGSHHHKHKAIVSDMGDRISNHSTTTIVPSHEEARTLYKITINV